tara:strand:+ start:14282 stop:15937 length:1656 start_codon:yes stop_codon:yes gene_type:complete
MPTNQLKTLKGQRSNNSNSRDRSLISARVYDIILDETHPFFSKTLEGQFDSTYIGAIFWAEIGTKEGNKDIDPLNLNIAKPYFSSTNILPLRNEIVTLTLAPSLNHYSKTGGYSNHAEYYYFPSVNVWGNAGYNPLPREADLKSPTVNPGQVAAPANLEEDFNLELGTYIDENKVASTKKMLPFEGDMLFEGRFGNSIRFGSSTPQGKNSWSENDSEGDPIIVISNGQSGDDEMVIENINEDASSIYMLSNQNVSGFSISADNFRSLGENVNLTPSTEPITPLQKINLFTRTDLADSNNAIPQSPDDTFKEIKTDNIIDTEKGTITPGILQDPTRNLGKFLTETPWSAAFISYTIAEKAGISFPRRANHVGYAQTIKNGGYPFSVIDPFLSGSEGEVKPGDIFIKGRGGNKLKFSDDKWKGASHGDIVVKVQPGRVDLVGGNVSELKDKEIYGTDINQGTCRIKKLTASGGKIKSLGTPGGKNAAFVIIRPINGEDASKIVKAALEEANFWKNRSEIDPAVTDTLITYWSQFPTYIKKINQAIDKDAKQNS